MANKLTRFQSFEPRTVHRSLLKEAAYNPRRISDDAYKRLKKSIRDDGLVEPLVWNERTGNLVGGHRRLAILDELNKGQDYELIVSVVNVDPQTEKKLNVKLNNRSMQGEFDEEALSKLLQEFDVAEWTDFGFTDAEVEFMKDGVDLDEFRSYYTTTPQRNEDDEKLREIKQDRQAMRERLAQEQAADFFTVLVFESVEERDAFHLACGLPVSEVYVRGYDVYRLIGADHDGTRNLSGDSRGEAQAQADGPEE